MRIFSIAALAILMTAFPVPGEAAFRSLGFSIQRVEVLKVARPDGSVSIPIPWFDYPRAQFSPDKSRHLLFLGTHPSGGFHCYGLCLQEAGRQPVLITAEAQWPTWNWTGTYFAFVAPRSSAQQGAYPESLYVYRRQPLELVRRIDSVIIGHYAWSPSGDQLVVTGRGSGDRPPDVVRLVDVRSGTVRDVDRIPWMRDHEGQWWIPEVPGFSWSPDGQYLVYSRVQRAVSQEGAIDADLVIVRASDGTRQQLTHTPLVAEEWPRWVSRNRIVVIRSHFTPGPPDMPFVPKRTDLVTLHLATPRGMLDVPIPWPTAAQPVQDASRLPLQSRQDEVRPLYYFPYCWAYHPNPCVIDVGLDWGHCGPPEDRGALGVNGPAPVDEWEINRAVAVRLHEVLVVGGVYTVIVHVGGRPCFTLTERAEVIFGRRRAPDGKYYLARAGVSVHHNSFDSASAFGTEVLRHHQSRSTLSTSVLSHLYSRLSTLPDLSTCTANRGIKSVNKDVPGQRRGWQFLYYLFDRNIPAIMTEALFISNRCQWEAATDPYTYYDPNATVVNWNYVRTEAAGIKDGIDACKSNWPFCGPR